MTVTCGLLVRLEAKPGKEKELQSFLEAAQDLARRESQTVTWYAFRAGDREFGIFDTFASEEGRRAHLGAEVAQALAKSGPALLAKDPEITPVDIVGASAP
jgi:quinol monooxygenase YgiN